MKTLYVCLLAAANCFAASIGGFVSDVSGGAVPGAQVIATHMDSQKQMTATTSESGTYSFGDLPTGRYQLVVRAPGFSAAVRSLMLEDAKSAKTMPIIVDVGQITESIEVVGQGIPAPAAAQKVRIGGAVKPPKVLQMPRVAYPASARARGVEGHVVVRCVVLKDGSVGAVKAIQSPDSELEQAVVEAVKQWRYDPAMLNGVPVEVVTTLTVNFRLKP